MMSSQLRLLYSTRKPPAELWRTLGPSDADKVLKDAKAIGVDEIVRLWDDSWAELDSNGIQSLAQAVA